MKKVATIEEFSEFLGYFFHLKFRIVNLSLQKSFVDVFTGLVFIE